MIKKRKLLTKSENEGVNNNTDDDERKDTKNEIDVDVDLHHLWPSEKCEEREKKTSDTFTNDFFVHLFKFRRKKKKLRILHGYTFLTVKFAPQKEDEHKMLFFLLLSVIILPFRNRRRNINFFHIVILALVRNMMLWKSSLFSSLSPYLHEHTISLLYDTTCVIHITSHV